MDSDREFIEDVRDILLNGDNMDPAELIEDVEDLINRYLSGEKICTSQRAYQ